MSDYLQELFIDDVKFLGVNGTEQLVQEITTRIATGDADKLSYNKQTLTDTQLAQVRENLDIIQIPAPTSSDNGKFLRVVEGSAAWDTIINAEEVAY